MICCQHLTYALSPTTQPSQQELGVSCRPAANFGDDGTLGCYPQKTRFHVENVQAQGRGEDEDACGRRKGDVLFKARGPRLEAFALQFQPENTIATNAFIILRPQKDILPRYIAWLLNNMNFSRIIQQTHVIQSVSLKQLSETEIPVPNLGTQLKIIEIQDEIEAGRLLANQYFDAASEMLRGHVLKIRGR